MRKSYYSEKDLRRNRTVAIVASLLLHSMVTIGLFFANRPPSAEERPAEEMTFGSSGGGGGEGKEGQVDEFGPASRQTIRFGDELLTTTEMTLVDVEIIDEHVENAVPVIKKEEPKPKKKRMRAAMPSIIAENLPLRHVRRGVGPGSDGGTGGGSGGGIGRGQGYAIDWGGTGSRRLLSGRLPLYPKGTDKQMAVVLLFAVLPDGSVEQIRPSRKSDELLERAAIAALQTWRFDPLPLQVAQTAQTGKVTFNFKLE